MKTTNRGLKSDTTRHTLEIKKDHLKIIQALALYNHLTIVDTLTQLLDNSIKSIDNKTLTKALAELDERRSKKKSIFN